MNYYFDVICVHAFGAKQFVYYTSLLKNSLYDIVIYILDVFMMLEISI